MGADLQRRQLDHRVFLSKQGDDSAQTAKKECYYTFAHITSGICLFTGKNNYMCAYEAPFFREISHEDLNDV